MDSRIRQQEQARCLNPPFPKEVDIHHYINEEGIIKFFLRFPTSKFQCLSGFLFIEQIIR